MNLANVYDYVPVRTFAAGGDIAHICRSLGLSPWWIVVALTPPVAAGLVHLHRTLLPRLYAALHLAMPARVVMLLLTSGLMFGHFGLAGLREGDRVSALLSGCSLLALPAVLALCWPTRLWVRENRALEPRPAVNRAAPAG